MSAVFMILLSSGVGIFSCLSDRMRSRFSNIASIHCHVCAEMSMIGMYFANWNEM